MPPSVAAQQRFHAPWRHGRRSWFSPHGVPGTHLDPPVPQALRVRSDSRCDRSRTAPVPAPVPAAGPSPVAPSAALAACCVPRWFLPLFRVRARQGPCPVRRLVPPLLRGQALCRVGSRISPDPPRDPVLELASEQPWISRLRPGPSALSSTTLGAGSAPSRPRRHCGGSPRCHSRFPALFSGGFPVGPRRPDHRLGSG